MVSTLHRQFKRLERMCTILSQQICTSVVIDVFLFALHDHFLENLVNTVELAPNYCLHFGLGFFFSILQSSRRVKYPSYAHFDEVGTLNV